MTGSDHLTWGGEALSIEIGWGTDRAPFLASARTGSGAELSMGPEVPLIQVLTARNGRSEATGRLIQTKVGDDLRYAGHHTSSADGVNTLLLTARGSGVTAVLSLTSPVDVGAIRAVVTVRNDADEPLVLRSVASWACSFGARSDGGVDSWHLVSGESDWLAEGRWRIEDLRERYFPRLGQEVTGHNPRGAHVVTSTGTWSTGSHLPIAAVESASQSAAWMWQIEHNGAWRWEVGENTADAYFAASGPTESDHSWTRTLRTGESFTSVPVAIVLGPDFEGAVAALNRYRRSARRPHPDNERLGVVYSDYMNTLNGDPTADKLLPLVEAAGEVGAEFFCLDAGWYDDTDSWWDSVGAWEPSRTRFPRGLGEVTEAIRDRGMTPGLFVEPEVVGLRSPVASALPDSAFLLRRGQRILEHGRYHLDLRSPHARDHLDAALDRLIDEFGIGYFKLDYNINPGAGTDHESDSLGDGLLGHNRAHLAWLDSLLERHPGLVLENCGSGGMRMDFAMLSRLQLQSTSDQQDFTKYPPIAASAPVSILPEQAGNWAYPQPWMTSEEICFCLATSILGRLYLSGFLADMSPSQKQLVAEAVRVHKSLRSRLAQGQAFWPLGLPQWEDPWVSLGIHVPGARLVTIWNRQGQRDLTIHIPSLVGNDIVVRTLFPSSLEPWETLWDANAGTLAIHTATERLAARVFELRTTGPESIPFQQ